MSHRHHAGHHAVKTPWMHDTTQHVSMLPKLRHISFACLLLLALILPTLH